MIICVEAREYHDLLVGCIKRQHIEYFEYDDGPFLPDLDFIIDNITNIQMRVGFRNNNLIYSTQSDIYHCMNENWGFYIYPLKISKLKVA